MPRRFARLAASLVVLVFLLNGLSGCASRPVPVYVHETHSAALPPGPDGPLFEVDSGWRAHHGEESSGFAWLDSNEDGLQWRLRLIDSARYSIDAQYYLWYGDTAGRLIIQRLLAAAERGVRVRLLVDDLNTLIRDAGTVTQRDNVVGMLDAQPNVEVRLFNPWRRRDLPSRLSESLVEFQRVNVRMHNKALVVDNHAAIVGGRNIGDEYMGLSRSFNFHDLDVLAVGAVVRRVSDVFDLYWNSSWVMPVSALGERSSDEEIARAGRELDQSLAEETDLSRFAPAPELLNQELDALPGRLHPGSARVLADLPAAGEVQQVLLEEIRESIRSAQREVMIVNAYIIPSDVGVDIMRTLRDDGVAVRMLTNSLASQDVPAVNSHYKRWRRPFLEAGVDLYEFRHDPGIQAEVIDTHPRRSKFAGLHSKAMVVDRLIVYVGSMNFDPRSAAINTETAIFIHSEGLAAELVQLIHRDTAPANSWRVTYDTDRGLTWTSDEEVTRRQPARNFWQRVGDLFFQLFPKEYY